MLPQNYQISQKNRTRSDDEDDERLDGRRPHALPSRRLPPQQQQQPPLGVTGVLCDTNSLPIRGRGTVQYTIFRPRYVKMKPPLICVAGGPYLPWQYLSTLVHLVNDRSLIFFNPIGCGQSKRSEENTTDTATNSTASNSSEESSSSTTATNNNNNNPVTDTVQDLIQLVQHLQLEHYHLYGHSFGGIVAYEALLDDTMPGTCLSLTLSSTPANLPHALEEIDQLKAQLAPEAAQQSAFLENPEHAVAHLFAERHECRVRPLPLQLQQSFAMAGFSSSPAGWQSIKDYVVQTPAGDDDDDDKKLKLPLLLLRGEFDFISNACMEPWWDCVASSLAPDDDHPNIVTIPGVAHYGMLEDEQGYGSVIREFLARVPEPALQIPRPGPPSSSSRPRSRLSR